MLDGKKQLAACASRDGSHVRIRHQKMPPPPSHPHPPRRHHRGRQGPRWATSGYAFGPYGYGYGFPYPGGRTIVIDRDSDSDSDANSKSQRTEIAAAAVAIAQGAKTRTAIMGSIAAVAALIFIIGIALVATGMRRRPRHF